MLYLRNNILNQQLMDFLRLTVQMRIPNFVIGIFIIFPSRGGDNEQRTEMRFFWKERKRKKTFLKENRSERNFLHFYISTTTTKIIFTFDLFVLYYLNKCFSFIHNRNRAIQSVQSTKQQDDFLTLLNTFFRMNNNF